MGEGAEEALSRISNQIAALLDALRQVTGQSGSAGADAGRDMAARIDQAAASFEAAAGTVAETLAQATQALQERMTDAPASGSARLSGQFERMIEDLRFLAEATRQTGDQALSALADRIGAAALGFEASAGRVADALTRSAETTGTALGQSAEAAVHRLAAATEGMRTELQAMLAEFRTTLGEAGDVLRRGGTDGAAALTDSLGGAAKDLAQAIASAASVMRDTGDTTSAELQRGGEKSAGARLDQAAVDIATRAGALSREVEALTQAASELPTRVADLERALGAATPSFASSASDMRAAGEAVRTSVQPLRDVGRSVLDAIGQINSAAQNLQGAEARVQTLAQGLATAAQRFDGLDRELAKVVDRLTARLQEFTRQTSDFATQIDRNLANAANQLGKVVVERVDALEDHRPRQPGASRTETRQPAGSRL
jgi:ABC-type transporter Mla subunit MlaD